MNAVDTNILLYAHDRRDLAKQAVSLSLLRELPDGVLLWQAACEFIAASRKLAPLGYTHPQSWQDIHDLRRVWTTIVPGWGTMDRAQKLMDRYSLSFWDAMIVAACLEGGVARLYSENFDAYPRVDGLEIVNPFKEPGSNHPTM